MNKESIPAKEGDWHLVTAYKNGTTVMHDALAIADKPVSANDNLICLISPLHLVTPQDEAHAKLIAEAGTVANQTGLTPMQLMQHRKVLLEALTMVKSHWDAGNFSRNPVIWDKINEAIKIAQ